MTDAPTLAQIAEASGLSYRALAARFGIPTRTVEDWSAGRRHPPEYVLRMMAEILRVELN